MLVSTLLNRLNFVYNIQRDSAMTVSVLGFAANRLVVLWKCLFFSVRLNCRPLRRNHGMVYAVVNI